MKEFYGEVLARHAGPYPATGHPRFTALGMRTAIHRFAKLQCYDKIRSHRLPACLKDANPNGKMWRLIDDVVDKVAEYFQAGVKLAWVIFPSQSQVYAYTSPTDVRVLTRNDRLTAERLLPGFELPLSELFEEVQTEDQ